MGARLTCPWHLLLAAALIVACLLAAAAPSRAAGVTGIADQGMQSWSPLAQTWAGALGPEVTQARYNTAWDVALHEHDDPCEVACLRFRELVAWLKTARRDDRRVLIAFDRQPGCNASEPGCPPPSVDAYRAAVRAFRVRFPAVTEFTAWNEPNHHMLGTDGVDSNPAGDPTLAAAYWNALNEACAIPSATGATCTVAAGDLLAGPGDVGMRRYLPAYAAALAEPPAAWAVHPYTAVGRGDRRSLDVFLAGTGTAPVWFTEIGAQHCVGEVEFGDAAQDADAQRLVELMAATAPRLTRTYYYQLMSGTSCDWDSALLAPDETPRPALATLFPATAWWQPATVQVSGRLGALAG